MFAVKVPWKFYQDLFDSIPEWELDGKHPMDWLQDAFGLQSEPKPGDRKQNLFDYREVQIWRRQSASNPSDGTDYYVAVTPAGELWLQMNMPLDFERVEVPC